MWLATQHPGIPPSHACSDADALFVSALQRSETPDAGQIRQAIGSALGAFGHVGCAERVAQEFGDHPATATARMRWALSVAGQALNQAVAA